MAGFRGLFTRVFLIGLFVSVFWVACVGAEVIVADFSENDLKGHMSWGEFLDNCVEGGTPYHSGGIFDSIEVHLIIDTDKETVTGSLSGSGSFSNNVNLYTQEYSFDGSISGAAKRVFWGGYMWEWEFEADVELDLSFSTSYRCNTPTAGEYNWISKEETVHVSKMLRMDTAADNNQQFMSFSISWKDYDEQYDTPIIFYMTHKNENEQRRAILPLEMPDPIDLDVAISGPEQIGRGDSSATFDMTTKGNEINKVQNVHWYFYFFDDIWEDYRWFESFEKDSISDLTVDASKIVEWMEYLDDFGTTVDGVKTLPMQLYVELEAEEDEGLAVSPRHNFTLTSAHSTRFKLDIIDVIDIYPTGKNVTYFELDHSGTMLNKPVTFEIE
jgi:hypothetical protein